MEKVQSKGMDLAHVMDFLRLYKIGALAPTEDIFTSAEVEEAYKKAHAAIMRLCER